MKALLLALALLCSDSAWAARSQFEMRCEAGAGKAVTISAQSNGYSIDNTHSIKALAVLKGANMAGAFVLGVTRAQAQLTMDSNGELHVDPLSGYECKNPKISVALYYSPITIFIGSEFSPGTCAYREILAHEMRHLKTYLDHLPKVETVVRKALDKRFDNRPLYARIGKVDEVLKREIDSGWMPYMKRELGQVETLQDAIDTPAEYMRLSRVCEGEVQSIIGPADRARR